MLARKNLIGYFAFFIVLLVLFSRSEADFPPPYPEPDTIDTDTLHSDLILSGNDSMLVENKLYVVMGNVYISGNAKLIIRNSKFVVIHQPREEINVMDSATVDAYNTIFEDFLYWGFSGHSNLIFDRVYTINVIGVWEYARANIENSYIYRESFGSISAGNFGLINIKNSIVGSIGIDIPPHFPVVIDSLMPDFFEHWDLQEEICDSLTYDIILDSTEIMDNPGYTGGVELGFSIGLSGSSDVIITNSVLNKIGINFFNENIDFSDLHIGTPISFNFRDIDVSNTIVRAQWGMFVDNGAINIDNSDGIWLWPCESDEPVTISNTNICEFDPRHYSGTITLTECTMEDGFEILDSNDCRIDGSVLMYETSPLFDAGSRLTRNYEVIVLQDGAVLPDIPLSLTENGIEIWSGITGGDGTANFDLVFDVNNCDSVWRLTIPETSIEFSRDVSIRSSTPIVVNLKPAPDGIHLWPFLIVDDDVSGFGDGTFEKPYKNIGQGLNNIGDVGYVYVMPGEYNEIVSLRDSVCLFGSGSDVTKIIGDVFAWNITNARISGFTIEDTTTSGIHCYYSSILITNNIILNQPDVGIFGIGSDLTITNNDIVYCGMTGIAVDDSSSAFVENNIIIENSEFGISSSPTATCISDYNDVWNNTGGNYDAVVPGDSSISCDPLFVDAAGYNFHLQSESQCIDAGNPAEEYNDSDGSRNDIGAFGGQMNWLMGIKANNKTEMPREIFLRISPNPFNSSCAITAPAGTEVKIYDLRGNVVVGARSPRPTQKGAETAPLQNATRTFIWHPDKLISSGIYLVRANLNGQMITKRIVYLK